MPVIHIREATPSDLDTVVEFNRGLARETEGKELPLPALTAGVRATLADRDHLAYWVAEQDGVVVGQAAVSREWSDWRNGWIWWLQSVYVGNEHRGSGVFRTLFEHISVAAKTSGAIGLRLYVEKANTAAHKTYEALGMKAGDYEVYEQFFIPIP